MSQRLSFSRIRPLPTLLGDRRAFKGRGWPLSILSHYIEEGIHGSDRILVLAPGPFASIRHPSLWEGRGRKTFYPAFALPSFPSGRRERRWWSGHKPGMLFRLRHTIVCGIRRKEEGCSIQEIENQSKFIDSTFENTKEVGREDETHESSRRGWVAFDQSLKRRTKTNQDSPA